VPEQIAASGQWGQVISYGEWNALERAWLASATGATGAGVQAAVEVFACEAAGRRPHTLIVDITGSAAWGRG
jgi:hypothetical protein